MKHVKKSIDRVIEFLTCTLFLIMIAVASWQVLSRFILKNPSTFTEELLRYSLIWLAMLATAYVVGKSEHIAISFLRDKMDEDSGFKLDIVIQAFFLLFSATIMLRFLQHCMYRWVLFIWHYLYQEFSFLFTARSISLR